MAGVFKNIDPPPSPPGECVPPPLVRGEDTLARRGGWGVNILENVRHSSVLYVCPSILWPALTSWRFEADTCSQSVLLSRWRSASALRPVSSSLAASCARSASTWPSLAFRLTISTFIYRRVLWIWIRIRMDLLWLISLGSGSGTNIQCCGLRIRIQIQDNRSIRIWIQFWIRITGFVTKICKMFQLKKSIFLLSKITTYFFIPRRTWGKSKLQEKPTVINKKKHQALQNSNVSTFLFLMSFLPSWIWIQPTKMGADPCRSESKYTTKQKSSINLIPSF